MVMTVKQLMDFSWMSQASYLDFSGLDINAASDIFAGRLKSSTINEGNVFAPGQATTFTDPADSFSFINK